MGKIKVLIITLILAINFSFVDFVIGYGGGGGVGGSGDSGESPGDLSVIYDPIYSGFCGDGVCGFGEDCNSCPQDCGVCPIDDSAFISQSVPTQMIWACPSSVSLTFTNTGTTTWSSPDYKLSSINPKDTTRFGLNRVDMTQSVEPLNTYSFVFNAVPAGPAVRAWPTFCRPDARRIAPLHSRP